MMKRQTFDHDTKLQSGKYTIDGILMTIRAVKRSDDKRKRWKETHDRLEM